MHSGSISAMIDYKKIEFNYSFIYTGERYSQKANISSNYLDPWFTHDLSLGKMLLFNQKKLKVLVAVNNVFNQQYAVVKNFPMPGRSYRFTLNFLL